MKLANSTLPAALNVTNLLTVSKIQDKHAVVGLDAVQGDAPNTLSPASGPLTAISRNSSRGIRHDKSSSC